MTKWTWWTWKHKLFELKPFQRKYVRQKNVKSPFIELLRNSGIKTIYKIQTMIVGGCQPYNFMTGFYNSHKYWWAVKDGVFPLHMKLPYSIFFLHLLNNTEKSLEIIKKNNFCRNSTIFLDFFFKYFNEITSVKMCMCVRSLPRIIFPTLSLYEEVLEALQKGGEISFL